MEIVNLNLVLPVNITMSSNDEFHTGIFNSIDVLLESSRKELKQSNLWKENMKVFFDANKIDDVKSFLQRSHGLHDMVSVEELIQMSLIATTMFEKHCCKDVY